jgi:redox-sensing transcriptional repressor
MRSSGSSSDSHAVPDIVVARLPLYLRALGSLLEAGREMVSSAELAEMLGVSSAQIRKDLSQFGEFGRQGAGYSVPALMARIRAILHIDREWPVVVIGAGSIGRAITNYSGFSDRGFRVCGIFDDDPLKIGALVGQLEVQAMDELPELLHRHAVRVAVLAVPGAVAQSVTDLLVVCGVRAILNYAPAALHVPDAVRVQNIDPVFHLQHMTYYLD